MTKVDKLLDSIYRMLQVITSFFLAIMLIITFSQVVMRYVFNKPFIWAEEVTLAILIWFAYLSISMSVKNDGHMSIAFFYNSVNDKTKLVLDLIKDILMIGFSGLMTFYGKEMIQNAQGKVLPASQISRAMLYIPMFISGILIIVFSMVHIYKRVKSNTKGGK